MRSEGQIRQQFKQVAYRHLQRLLRENFRQHPDSCCHNIKVVLDAPRDHTVGLCGFMTEGGSPRGVPCDARIPGCADMARQCPLWSPLQTKEQIKTEFAQLLHSGDRGEIAAKYPDLAALLWVLDTPKSVPTLEDIPDASVTPDEEVVPPHKWWDFIKKWGVR